MERSQGIRPLALLAALLAACTGSPAHEGYTPRWNAAAAQDAEARMTATMNAFAAMDVQEFAAGLAEDVTGYEFDLDGKAVRLGTRAEAERFASETFARLHAMGATLSLDYHARSCRATSAMAFCTVEFDLHAAMPDGGALSQPTRNTVVLGNGPDGWMWLHWHSSPAGPAPSTEPER